MRDKVREVLVNYPKLKRTLVYFARHPYLAISAIVFAIFASLFDTCSIGMIIPILQGITGSNPDFILGIPVINKFYYLITDLPKNEMLSILLIFTCGMVLATNFLIFVGKLTITRLRFVLTSDLQCNVIDSLIDSGTKLFDSVKTGYLINSAYNEANRIGNFMNSVLTLIGEVIKMIFLLILLFFISWQAAIASVLVIIIISLPIPFLLNKVRVAGVNYNQMAAKFNYHVLEILNGIRIVKIFRTEDYEKKRVRDVIGKLRHYNIQNRVAADAISPLNQSLMIVFIAAFYLTAVRFFEINILAILPFVLTYICLAIRMIGSFGKFNDYRSVAMNQLGAFDSYENLILKTKDSLMPNGTENIDRLITSIEFKDVCFSYEKDTSVLKNVEFSIKKGETTALVGRSGSGKTTLVNLIIRLYDPTYGSIEIDGINLKDLDIQSWRKKIGFVSQDVFIFNISARENICYGHFEATDEEIISAAKKAEIHDFIMKLPDGYNTIMGERGVKLSGGQRQRISIARAIIHNPEILILDEATSSLDTKTEKLIQREFGNLMKNRTVIMISHRLSTVINADNIVVIDKGRIVEQSDHLNLLKKEGVYSEIYNIQVKDKG